MEYYMKNVLVIGGGGREHAIIVKLLESPQVGKVYCTPGNGGIAKDAECFDVSATDIEGVTALAKKLQPDMIVVAPDDPLVLGMVDVLQAEGFKTFGPKKSAAIIEGSKAFSKELMKKYNIPTAEYEVFTDYDCAVAYLKTKNSYPTVIKADGLALGKGVIIAQDEAEAIDAVNAMLNEKKFGGSGSRIVIEEFLTGPEVSVLTFCDGKTVVPMISSMDHKRIGDGDTGLNTGGMGTVSPNPYYTAEIAQECEKNIFIPTINAMNSEGRTFEGCLYFGLMLTEKGAKVIEYNCRFGDPETQVVLPMLDCDLYEVFEAVYEHKLDTVKIGVKSGSCVCVIAASQGYPESYPKGIEINGLDKVENCRVYHAGTALLDGKTVTNGGRVLGVTATGETLEQAIKQAYNGMSSIHFEGMQVRQDIGERAMKAYE